jgi:hypothetical protein
MMKIVISATLCIGMLLVSCASPSKNQPAPIVSQHWVNVSSHPPTFYPRGVAPDCPTDSRSGEWVYTGDAKGTRFFIPLRGIVGIPRQTLVQEAMDARSEKIQRQIGQDDIKYHAMQIILFPIYPLVEQ